MMGHTPQKNASGTKDDEITENVRDPLDVNEERVSELVDRIRRSPQSFRDPFKNVMAVSIEAGLDVESSDLDSVRNRQRLLNSSLKKTETHLKSSIAPLASSKAASLNVGLCVQRRISSP